MGQILDPETEGHIRSTFERLHAPVTLLHFTQEHAVGPCREQRLLLEELCALADSVSLEVHVLNGENSTAMRFGVSTVPVTAVVGSEDYGIRFYGLTGGYQLETLVQDIVMVSTGRSGLDVEAAALAKRIDVPTNVQVLTTLNCRHSTAMARLAHQLAFMNESIGADVINIAEFPHVGQRHEMTSTPMTVINETHVFQGALQPKNTVLEILKAVMPRDYQHEEDRPRAGRRDRRNRRLEPGHVYDALIIGAGPAGMSAAIYAARKNMDIAVIGEEVGGQIAASSMVENWPGTPSISGTDLMQRFQDHMAHYSIAEGFGIEIDRIDKLEAGFVAHGRNGGAFRGRTVIFCGGKKNRTLGAPGESRFLGKGIGFCATCDAPQYRDKAVAIVGGGDSAMRAARDLAPFAREIHVVHILEEFQADADLLAEVQTERSVAFHTSMEVAEYLGRNRLQGIRLRAVGGDRTFDLLVDGVFLEIGQESKSQPVAGLLVWNEKREIPVERDQSTAVPGLFAAGDVTDGPDKQLLLATAQGAQAALSAHRYLIERRSEARARAEAPVARLREA